MIVLFCCSDDYDDDDDDDDDMTCPLSSCTSELKLIILIKQRKGAFLRRSPFRTRQRIKNKVYYSFDWLDILGSKSHVFSIKKLLLDSTKEGLKTQISHLAKLHCPDCIHRQYSYKGLEIFDYKTKERLIDWSFTLQEELLIQFIINLLKKEFNYQEQEEDDNL